MGKEMKYCCVRMDWAVDMGNIIFPPDWQDNKTWEMTYLAEYDYHGSCEIAIKFCPFCGTRLK